MQNAKRSKRKCNRRWTSLNPFKKVSVTHKKKILWLIRSSKFAACCQWPNNMYSGLAWLVSVWAKQQKKKKMKIRFCSFQVKMDWMQIVQMTINNFFSIFQISANWCNNVNCLTVNSMKTKASWRNWICLKMIIKYEF